MTDPSFAIGQAVRLLATVGDDPTGDSPGGTYGRIGNKVFITSIRNDALHFPISVHHEEVTDGSSFGVMRNEIEPWETATPTAGRTET